MRTAARQRQGDRRQDKLEILDKVYFEYDKAIIKSESYPILDAVAATLEGNPEINLVEIQGHTDERGNDAYNLRLTDDRAQAVKKYLIDKASPEPHGSQGLRRDAAPLAVNNEAAWSKNRRVEFVTPGSHPARRAVRRLRWRSGGVCPGREGRQEGIEDLNRAAMEDYDLEFENAKKQLDEALGLVKKNKPRQASGGGAHALQPRHRLGRRACATPTPRCSSLWPRSRSIRSRASTPPTRRPSCRRCSIRRRRSAGIGSGRADRRPSPQARPRAAAVVIEGLQHTFVDEAPAGRNILITAKVGADVGASKHGCLPSPGRRDVPPPADARRAAAPTRPRSPERPSRRCGALHRGQERAGKVVRRTVRAGLPNIVMIAGASGSSANFDDTENW